MANEETILNPESSNEQNEQINESTEVNNETEVKVEAEVKAETEAPKEVVKEASPPEEDKVEKVEAEDKPAEAPVEVAKVEETPAEAPKEEVKIEEAPVEATKEEAKVEETPAEAPKEVAKVEEALVVTAKKEEAAKILDEVFAKLKAIQEADETFDVTIKSRIRGGLRTMFEEFPLFLPVSHFSLQRNPSEDDMAASIEKTIKVKIHEIQESNGRRTVLVSRKKILETEFWDTLVVGEKVEGVVSSVAPFGVFLNLGGAEGLIHISRLSQVHVDDTKNFAKKGDKMEAVIVEIDREKNRIALSRKELEESPWTGVEEKFSANMICKGIVRRLTDFGAYVELEPGIDGLLRTSELNWTRRVKNPAEVLKPNQEIDVFVISANEKKHTVALSLKRTLVSPWPELASEYEIGKEVKGIVNMVMDQGMIVTLDEKIDGFMPRSKMGGIQRGKKIPFDIGDEITVFISDFDASEESLILAMQAAGEDDGKRKFSGKSRGRKENFGKFEQKGSSAFSFADLLSSDSKQKLIDSND